MDRHALIGAALVAAAAQMLLVVTGHFVAAVADNLFALGGMALSLAAGLLYARKAPRGRPILGGALAGLICAAIGISLSAALGDVPPMLIPLGGVAGAGAGALGALIAGRVFPRRAPAAAAKT